MRVALISVFALAVATWLGLHLAHSEDATPAPSSSQRYEITTSITDNATGKVVKTGTYNPDAGTDSGPLTFDSKDACNAFGKSDEKLHENIRGLLAYLQESLPPGVNVTVFVGCTPVGDPI